MKAWVHINVLFICMTLCGRISQIKLILTPRLRNARKPAPKCTFTLQMYC